MKLKYILFVIILIATSSSSFATSYTWVGTTSSWNLSSNWSPSGVPDSADNVTISSGTYSPLLDGNRKITNLTLSSKTIDLNGYSLTVYGTATMTSGTVTNGTFYARGNLASFNGTLMDCPVDAICGYIRLSGSTFNETADFTDLGTATGTGSGGCTFNDDVTITHTGTLTYFTLANTTGDTFNGNVTFTNNSNREIHIASSGATLFNGNIILNSTSSGGISFANGGGSATLATGKTISIGSSGFSADFLTLKNFTQNGSTAQTLTLTGTAVVNMIAATFGDAAALNELVADELALETHLKAVNSLYFTKLAPGDTLDDSDSSNVLEIALLPYFEGGEASFIGIGMLGLEHSPSIPQLRLGNEVPMDDIPPAPIAQLTNIYPNPTSDFFYVKTEGVKVEKLEIYDARIKLLITIEKNIVGSAISVNYKPGVYGVKLYLITGEVKWFKLVIV